MKVDALKSKIFIKSNYSAAHRLVCPSSDLCCWYMEFMNGVSLKGKKKKNTNQKPVYLEPLSRRLLCMDMYAHTSVICASHQEGQTWEELLFII